MTGTARLAHVALAVESVEQALPLWRDGLGMAVVADEVVAGEGVHVVKLQAGDAVIELLEPLQAGQGPVGGFLAKKGPGIHHLSVQVPDLEAAVAGLEAAGRQFLQPVIRPGSQGHRVAFLKPSSAGGVLLELEEECSRFLEADPT